MEALSNNDLTQMNLAARQSAARKVDAFLHSVDPKLPKICEPMYKKFPRWAFYTHAENPRTVLRCFGDALFAQPLLLLQIPTFFFPQKPKQFTLAREWKKKMLKQILPTDLRRLVEEYAREQILVCVITAEKDFFLYSHNGVCRVQSSAKAPEAGTREAGTVFLSGRFEMKGDLLVRKIDALGRWVNTGNTLAQAQASDDMVAWDDEHVVFGSERRISMLHLPTRKSTALPILPRELGSSSWYRLFVCDGKLYYFAVSTGQTAVLDQSQWQTLDTSPRWSSESFGSFASTVWQNKIFLFGKGVMRSCNLQVRILDSQNNKWLISEIRATRRKAFNVCAPLAAATMAKRIWVFVAFGTRSEYMCDVEACCFHPKKLEFQDELDAVKHCKTLASFQLTFDWDAGIDRLRATTVV